MSTVSPDKISRSYYSFQRYNSKQRMLSYWHQLSLAIECQPRSILEVGVGTGMVTSYLRHNKIPVATMDINPALQPDYVGSILSPPEELKEKGFDLVLCARVLHHIPFEEIELAISHLEDLTRKHCLVTVPVNDFRLYLMFRMTSTSIKTLTIPLPIVLKRILVGMKGIKGGSGVWQVNSRLNTSKKNVVDVFSRHFRIMRMFQIPEDQSHLVMLLQKLDEQAPVASRSKCPRGEDLHE